MCIDVLHSCSCCCHWRSVVVAITLYCCILFFVLFLLLLLSPVVSSHRRLLLCRRRSSFVICLSPSSPSCCYHGVLLFHVVSRCFVLFRVVVLVVLFHRTFNLLSTTPIFWLVFLSKFGPTSMPQQVSIVVYESDAMRMMSHYGQQHRKKRKEEDTNTNLLNLFLFVLATLCVTVDGMRASAHPEVCVTRPSTRARP